MSADPVRHQKDTVFVASTDPADLAGRWVYLRDTGAGVLTGVGCSREGRWNWSLRTPEGEVEGTGFPHAAPLSRHALPRTRRARHHLRALRADLAEYAPEATAERGCAEHDLDLLELELADGQEGMVPFVEQIVLEVDPDAARVVIDPPPGLLDLEASQGTEGEAAERAAETGEPADLSGVELPGQTQGQRP